MSSTPSAFESPSKKVAYDIQADDYTASMEKINLYNAHVDVSGVDERKLIRKVDLRTIPWLTFLYLLCFLDRTSIGNAKVLGCNEPTVQRSRLTRLISCTTWSRTFI